jgi:hypothetical protein
MTAFIVFLIAIVVSAKFRKFVFTAIAVIACMLWYGSEMFRQSDDAARHQRIQDRAAGHPQMRPYEDQFVRPALPGESQKSVPQLPYDDGYSYRQPQQWHEDSAYPSGPIQPAPVDIFADPAPQQPSPQESELHQRQQEIQDYLDGKGPRPQDPNGNNPYSNGY